VGKGGKGGVIVLSSRGFDLWYSRSGGTNTKNGTSGTYIYIYAYGLAAIEAAPLLQVNVVMLVFVALLHSRNFVFVAVIIFQSMISYNLNTGNPPI
jgi:hypothetical protein